MIEFISQPWHWRFGVSSSFKAMCSIGGAGRFADYFRYDWKKHDWLLTFAVGASATVADLSELGISTPTENAEGRGFIPHDLFNFQTLATLKGFVLMVIGGFLIGFGTRYAGGCTSGHAITMTFVLLPLILSL